MCSALHFSWRFWYPRFGTVRRQTRIQENPYGNRNRHCPQHFLHGLCYIGVPIVFSAYGNGSCNRIHPDISCDDFGTDSEELSWQNTRHAANGQVSGSLFGPLLGGMLADRFGFTYTFFITSFVIFSSVLLVLFGVKEKHLAEKTAKRTSYSRKEVLSYIFHHPALWVMMLLTMLIQTGNFSIQPLLALYVNELHGPVNLAFFSGMAFSATGSEVCCWLENGVIWATATATAAF